MTIFRKSLNFISKHKYLVAIIFFIAIVGFLDSNSFYNIYKQRIETLSLKKEIQIYKARYDKDTRILKQLDAHPEAMQKIARERYFMKKPNEDVYIFSKE